MPAGTDIATVRRLLPALALAATLAACTSDEPARVTEPRTSSVPAPRGATLLRTTLLEAHNRARAALGLAPLQWDDTLVAAARGYAEEMARTGRFEHAPQPLGGPTRQGENLWTGTREAYRYGEMAGHWLAERKLYNGQPVPLSSRTGKFGDVAHYTQIVWRNSVRVGCAFASSRRDDYLVCRYAPAGNVAGERPY